MSEPQLEPTLPTTWYLSPGVFQTEKERIFCREWLAAGREEELQNPPSVACDHVAAYILKPRGADRTQITCHFLFETHEIEKRGFEPSDTVDFWDLVNRQDWTVCEAVQEGICARVHTHGYFAPMEDYNLDIRRYVRERIGALVRDLPVR